MRRLLFVSLVMLISCHPTAQTSVPDLTDGAIIEGIEVFGNRAISSEAIVAKIQTKAGDKIDTAAIKQDINNVRLLGFEDVRVREQNGTSGGKLIIFDVREKRPSV